MKAALLPRASHRLSAIVVFFAAVALGGGAAGAEAEQHPLAIPPLMVSVSGSDSNPCTQAAPCLSFNRAYHVAQLGQTVEVAAGTYGKEEIDPPAKSGSGVVLFTPAAGASVNTGQVSTFAVNHIEFNGFTANSFYISSDYSGVTPSDDITLRNISTTVWFIRSSNNISIIGGNSGYSNIADSDTIGSSGTTTVPSRNVLVDGTTVSNQQRTGPVCLPPNPACHPDGIFVQSVDGLTIRNSRFVNDDVLPIYFSRINNGPTSTNVLVENNLIDAPYPSGYYPLMIRWDGTPRDAPYQNIVIRFNSLGGSMNFPTNRNWCVPGTCEVIGNTGPMGQFQCVSSVVYRYNVWQGAKCDQTDKNAGNLMFAGATNTRTPNAFDFHLLRGAPQIDAVPITVPGPPTDVNGNLRPLRAARDAGAEQWDDATLRVGVGIGAVSIGMDRDQVAAFYGAARSVRSVRLGSRAPAMKVESYRFHAGTLSVAYDGDRVVGVSTTSQYYSGQQQVGVGWRGDAPPQRFSWKACPGGYLSSSGGVHTWLIPRDHLAGRPISLVWVLGSSWDRQSCPAKTSGTSKRRKG